MASCKIGNLSIDSTVFFLCDMQEFFRAKIAYFPQITNVANRMVKAAHHLGIPVIATEHKGCESTVPEIDVASVNCKPFTKTTFSMFGCDGVREELMKMKHIKSVVIFGVMRLRHSGAIVSLSKPTLYNLVKSTDHPQYAAVNELVNNAPPDAGLVNAYG